MTTRLPPLTALRAFEAAARHLSFAQAAAELNVTPAALSFQIKSLEEHLGAPLFRRLNRAVDLTEAGRTLASGTSEGFQALTAAWRATKRLQDESVLTVTAGPGFTAKWLAPRLFEFARANPDIELRVAATLKILDFAHDEIDIAIRFGYGPDPGLYSLTPAKEWFIPVMTPELAAQYKTPQDLLTAPLLHTEHDDFLDPPCNWAAWFRANGIYDIPRIATRFSQPDHSVDAALSGAGVALGRRAMVSKDLAEGRLVAPFDLALTSNAHFRFLCLKGAENRPQIRAFLEWVLAEVDKTTHVSDNFQIIPIENVPPAK